LIKLGINIVTIQFFPTGILAVFTSLLVLFSGSTASEQTTADGAWRQQAQSQCRHLGVLYSQYVDGNQAQSVANLFTESGVLLLGEARIVGREAIKELFVGIQSRKNYTSRHLVSDESVTVKSATAAEGRSKVSVFHYPNGIFDLDGEVQGKPVAVAEYVDQYLLSKAGCLISYRKIMPVFVQKHSVQQQATEQ